MAPFVAVDIASDFAAVELVTESCAVASGACCFVPLNAITPRWCSREVEVHVPVTVYVPAPGRSASSM